MKKFFAISLAAVMALSVAACSSDDVDDPVNLGGGQETIATNAAGGNAGDNQEQGASSDDYVFEVSGTSVKVNTNVQDALAVLGEDYTYFESESCAYQGLDKIYQYSNFTIYTYPDGDNDFISSIELKSDSIQTPEGIALGATKADVEATYGTDYATTGNVMVYTKGETKLSFVVIDDSVEGIVYDYANLIQAQN